MPIFAQSNTARRLATRHTPALITPAFLSCQLENNDVRFTISLAAIFHPFDATCRTPCADIALRLILRHAAASLVLAANIRLRHTPRFDSYRRAAHHANDA